MPFENEGIVGFGRAGDLHRVASGPNDEGYGEKQGWMGFLRIQLGSWLGIRTTCIRWSG